MNQDRLASQLINFSKLGFPSSLQLSLLEFFKVTIQQFQDHSLHEQFTQLRLSLLTLEAHSFILQDFACGLLKIQHRWFNLYS